MSGKYIGNNITNCMTLLPVSDKFKRTLKCFWIFIHLHHTLSSVRILQHKITQLSKPDPPWSHLSSHSSTFFSVMKGTSYRLTSGLDQSIICCVHKHLDINVSAGITNQIPAYLALFFKFCNISARSDCIVTIEIERKKSNISIIIESRWYLCSSIPVLSNVKNLIQ